MGPISTYAVERMKKLGNGKGSALFFVKSTITQALGPQCCLEDITYIVD